MGTIQEMKTTKGEKRYVAMIRRTGLKTYCKSFLRSSDAKAWMMQEEVKIQQSLHIEGFERRGKTLTEAIEKFLDNEPYHPYRTAHLREWQKSLQHKVLLANINSPDINEITSKWKKIGPFKIPLQPATLNRYLSSLSLLFESAKKWGWIVKNPVKESQKFKEPAGRVRYLNDEERDKLFLACRKNSYRPLELIVLIAISTGMRKEELMSLRWSQVDLQNGNIILNRTKNGSQRRVYLRGSALNKMKDYSKIRRIDTDLLFPGKNISPVTAKASKNAKDRSFDIRKPWNRAIKDAQIDNFHFHDLRHSCASYLAMCGASHLEIAEILGHKTLELVKRYAHLSDTHTASVVERMNYKLFESSKG